MDKFLILSIAIQWVLVPVNTHKIIDGNPITIHQAPYQVRLGLLDSVYGGVFICSGTVISQRLVLLPAECFRETQFAVDEFACSQYFIVAGSVDATNILDDNVQQFKIKKLVKHPDFDEPTVKHNIAIIFLDSFIHWNSPTIKAVALAERGPSTGEKCLTSGWGLTEEDEFPSTLMQATVTVVTHVCFDNSSDIETTYILTDPDKTNAGDIGAPLICSHQLSGILSYGMFCGPPYDKLGLYTNISYYRDWILSVNSSLENSAISTFHTRRSINIRDGCFIVLYAFLLWT